MTAAKPPTLESIIDAVTESYRSGREIDSLESSALPNRRQIVEALHHLEHVVFLGFYTTERLNEGNLRGLLSAHLRSATDILTEQIARAVVYGRHGGPSPEAVDLDWSHNAVLAVLAQIPAIRELLSLDVRAAYRGDPSANSIEEIVFSYPAVLAIMAHRIAHEFYRREVPMIPRILSEHAHSVTGIDIHPGAHIGKRFFIDHGTGVVIGETAIIGDDVKLYQGVTLGALSFPRDEAGELIRETKRHPTLEDAVTVYSGATILGGGTVIGAHSVIGANTWITESVPPRTRVIFSASPCSSGQRQTTSPPPPPPPGAAPLDE
ncbi:MAG: serine O-acetyltransferase EpsC [Polyangiales bacterium]